MKGDKADTMTNKKGDKTGHKGRQKGDQADTMTNKKGNKKETEGRQDGHNDQQRETRPETKGDRRETRRTP